MPAGEPKNVVFELPRGLEGSKNEQKGCWKG